MKKIILGLGTLATIVTPLSTVVACGSDDKDNGIVNKFKLGYDDNLKLITIDISEVSIQWQKRQEYKDNVVKVIKYLDDFNKDQSVENFNKIKEWQKSVSESNEKIVAKNASPKNSRNYMDNFGMMIRTHPDAIGILTKNISDGIIKNGDKYVFAKNQVQYSLDTFNIIDDFCYPGEKMRETFEFELGKPFKMPEHRKWCTSSELLSKASKEELEKPLNVILEALKKKPENLTEEQKKEYPKAMAKAKIMFSNPSQDMKIYYYVNDGSSIPPVKTEKEFLDQISNNIVQYLQTHGYFKNNELQEK